MARCRASRMGLGVDGIFISRTNKSSTYTTILVIGAVKNGPMDPQFWNPHMHV